jgi:Helix-turn-helix
MKRTPVERFLKHIRPLPSGCWRWRGPEEGLQIDGKQMSPRKLAWLVAHGAYPTFRHFTTTCGSSWCVTPSHLMEGKKPKPRRKGKRLPAEELPELRCRRQRGWSLARLSDYYGISVSGVSRIVNGSRRASAA